MKTGGSLVVLLAVSTAVLGIPAPQSVSLGGGEVGASFGGYKASAGLGGLLGGKGAAAGGLHAEAGTGGGGPSAAAGLAGLLSGGGGGGGKLYSGATTGTGAASSYAGGGGYAGGSGGGKGGGFYDRIFDIPISALNAVSRLLSQGGSGVTKTSVSSRIGDEYTNTVFKTKTKKFVVPPAGVYQPSPPAHGSAAFASASASTSSSGVHAGGIGAGGIGAGGAQGGGFYDRVFDIPVSVLNAVNRFLNEKNGR